MKSLRYLGLGIAILAASGSALAGQGRHDHRGHHGHHGHGHHHGPHKVQHYSHPTHYAHPGSHCTVKTKVSGHGRHYKEEIRCKSPQHVYYSPPPVRVIHAPPRHHVHVVHAPPPPAVVIGPHGMKVHGTVAIGW